MGRNSTKWNETFGLPKLFCQEKYKNFASVNIDCLSRKGKRLPGRWKQDSGGRRGGGAEPRAMKNYSQIGGGLNQETSNIFTGRFQNCLHAVIPCAFYFPLFVEQYYYRLSMLSNHCMLSDGSGVEWWRQIVCLCSSWSPSWEEQSLRNYI